MVHGLIISLMLLAQQILPGILNPVAASGGSCTGGGSTPTIVQGGAQKTTSSTTVAFTTSSGAVGAGHQLFVYSWSSTASLTATIADVCTGGGTSQGTWTLIEGPVSATPATGQWYLWGIASANSCTGTDTITVTWSGTGAVNFGSVGETTNASLTVDQGPAGASGNTSGSITTLFANELLLSPYSGGNGNANPTVPTGYTSLGVNSAGSTNPAFAGEAVSSCSTYSAAWTCAGCGTAQTSIISLKHN